MAQSDCLCIKQRVPGAIFQERIFSLGGFFFSFLFFLGGGQTLSFASGVELINHHSVGLNRAFLHTTVKPPIRSSAARPPVLSSPR